MNDNWYCEWSSHVPVAVVNVQTKQRYWFDQLDEDKKEEALEFRIFDVNRGRFVGEGGRRHAFIMHRKHIRF